MKNIQFNNVKIGDIIIFDNKGINDEAIVCQVNEKTFVVRTMYYFKNIQGIDTFTTRFYHFHKTGTKTHHRYTFGNAIAITSSINIMGA